MKRFLLLFIFLVLVSGCSFIDSSKGTGETFPSDPRDRREARYGKLTGEGGLSLFGSGEDSGASSGITGLAVNAYLWRASLDTLSFVPLAQADPVAGVILTDWYENPETPGERYKINVIMLDKKLRVDGVRVSVFKQVLEKGNWRDAKANETTARELEDKILARAREIRIGSIKK